MFRSHLLLECVRLYFLVLKYFGFAFMDSDGAHFDQVIWPKQIKERDSWRPKSLCFNLSHTKSLLACAVTLNTPVSFPTTEYWILAVDFPPSDLYACTTEEFVSVKWSTLFIIGDSSNRQEVAHCYLLLDLVDDF